MAELEYSKDAIDTLKKFYRCDTLIYVEGDDDELFWSTVFRRCAETSVEAKSVGGSVELDKFIDRIVTEDLKVLAARDSDLLLYCGKNIHDPRVLYTYGYAIENTLYTERAIFQISQIWCKGKIEDIEQRLSEWLTDFHEKMETITLYDAANFLHNCGVSVSGDNIARFSKTPHGHHVDQSKVSSHIKKIKATITDEMIAATSALENPRGKDSAAWIRGHFLSSAVLHFISHQIKEAGLSSKISYDALYSNAVQALDSLMTREHPHYDHYSSITKSGLSHIG
jgi:hypothetical protein